MGDPIRGIGVSGGVAVGNAHLLHAEPLPIVPDPIPPERVAEEIERFHAARQAAIGELGQLERQVRDALGERFAGILEAQKFVLEDPSLIADTAQRIRVGRVSARWALKEVVGEFLRKFDAIDDDYLRERGGELADVHRRVQRLLRGETAANHDVPEGSIVVAHSLGPADAIVLAGKGVVGLATDAGGLTSHTAILAQALGIPAVVGLHDFSRRVMADERLILDGDSGEVIRGPSSAQLQDGEARRSASIALEDEMASDRDLPAVTRDGTEIVIRANIEFAGEVDRGLRFGAHGVGLYRSEFLFLSYSPDLPSADEHAKIYGEIAGKVAPHAAVIRTLDLGGEKYFHEVLGRREPHPMLGLRAVRFCLERPEIFRPQLEGLLRAAALHDNLSVMLPLISTVDEVLSVRRLLAETARRLEADGVPVRADVPLGIMIEVPAAAVAADVLAQESDFLSLGTNDLIQYTLAVDRSNESVVDLYQPRHPAVLRMLKMVVEAGGRQGIPVSICGEMAADLDSLELLLGLGLRELSVQPRAVGPVRNAVRRIDLSRARKLAQEALDGVPAAQKSMIS
jgi:phosphotransferase system enzyme I (PtsI)